MRISHEEASLASHHRSGGKVTLASNISNILRRMLGWICGNKNELSLSSDRLQQLHLAAASNHVLLPCEHAQNIVPVEYPQLPMCVRGLSLAPSVNLIKVSGQRGPITDLMWGLGAGAGAAAGFGDAHALAGCLV